VGDTLFWNGVANAPYLDQGELDTQLADVGRILEAADRSDVTVGDLLG
jgi:hypothetical protein